ncbi:hypothetical protein [Mariniblastus fucicola]|uniref:Uncharacterized protein n=1 Tax=Mariniblastus fucicola TaxID=980251 RepID=A0A5B9PIV1_9BACT|nr:hypothetical protein [Mariniblastus fucicola]QEG22543.1 hypothetical protein MFFC18_24240 [Mariniblastus fucicola]
MTDPQKIDSQKKQTEHDEQMEDADDMLRWEEDGGQNVGSDYEWLPTTDEEEDEQDDPKPPADAPPA